VTDETVPLPIRQGLNVESGLNDGIAVPFYLVGLELAKAEASGSTSGLLSIAAQQIGIGVAAGLVAGALAGWVLRRFGGREWIETAWRQIVMLAGAILAFSAATVLGGSGFIAAFVGGVVFGLVARDRGLGTAYLSEEVSALLGAMVFIVAGAFALEVLPSAGWRVWAYAALSLTAVRMLPVAIATIGTRLKLPSIAFVGWFGPRGLASFIFGLGVLEVSIPHESLLIQTILATVVLSVLAHGLTATPFAAAYGRWYDRMHGGAAAEATEMPEQRTRLHLSSSASKALRRAVSEVNPWR
jgi:NhaP-type Na+/H+ or K+/H+ antiporter